MPDYPSSEDMLREFRAAQSTPPETDAPPPAAEAPPADGPPLDPPPPAPLPDPAPALPGTGDPFGTRTQPAREPYEPDTAPATGDDRHADWKPRGRSGPKLPAERRSRFGRLRPLLILAVVGAFAFGNLSALFDDSTEVADLAIGDCFNGGGEAELVETVDVVDCGEAHDFEVYARPLHPGSGAYPGVDAMFAWADEQCWDAFAPYVGASFEQSELFFTNFIPTDDSWDQGNRRATCMLHRFDEGFEIVPSVGSYRDTGV